MLSGKHIRLEALEPRHIEGLVAAAQNSGDLYRWTLVPTNLIEMVSYVETALAWREAGTALPYAIIRMNDGIVIGSTRFFNVEHWPWPVGHERHGRLSPDGCEIGYTWLKHDALRTGANTEAKFLMLTHAFETWEVFRICLHTDVRNTRSRAAIERLGAKSEGTLRAHRMAADYIARDSVRYSIINKEWPEVKRGLTERLRRGFST